MCTKAGSNENLTNTWLSVQTFQSTTSEENRHNVQVGIRLNRNYEYKTDIKKKEKERERRPPLPRVD